MAPGNVHWLLSSTTQSSNKSQSITTNRKTPPKPRPDPIAPTCLMVDDDPPKSLPKFYKNPYYLVRPGDEVAIWWEGDDKFYPGTVRNLRQDGKRRIEYTDGQVMYHNLNKEIFVLTGQAMERFLAEKFPDVAREHDSDHPVHYPALASLVAIGDSIEVYWADFRSFFPGFITGRNPNGWCSISYDDGDKGTIMLTEAVFRFVGMSAARAHSSLM